MGNLFIGFPVPRAKIADMITGSAPPTLHKTQHEDGGTDEIDCSGLAGAGGVPFPLRGFWADDYLADDSRWQKTYTGSGTLTRLADKLYLKTDSTIDSTARAYLELNHTIPSLTWAKKRHLVFRCILDCDSTPDTLIHITSGSPGNVNHIGFEIGNSKLMGINGKSAAQTKTDIKNFTDPYIDEEITLEAISYPGEKVEFWVNGVLEQTSTTNLPTGTSYAKYISYLKVDNINTANNVEVEFNHIQLYQEA